MSKANVQQVVMWPWLRRLLVRFTSQGLPRHQYLNGEMARIKGGNADEFQLVNSFYDQSMGRYMYWVKTTDEKFLVVPENYLIQAT